MFSLRAPERKPLRADKAKSIPRSQYDARSSLRSTAIEWVKPAQ